MLFELPTSIKSDAERLAQIPRLRELAAAGDIKAKVELAWELAEGKVIDADFGEATRLFDAAAASGVPDAQLNAARFMYLRRVPDGIRTIRKFAREGNFLAQFWMGMYYRSGRSRRSKLRAAVWFKRAQENGSVGAKWSLLGLQTQLASPFVKPALVLKVAFLFLKSLFSSTDDFDTEKHIGHTFTRLKRR